MSRLSQGHWFEVAFAAASACGVVGGLVVPAGPDDAQPGAGEDADGVWVAAAAGAGVAVDAFGPGRAVAGVVGPDGERLARFCVAGVAEADGVLAAAVFGDGHAAAERGGFVGACGAVEQRSDFGDELCEADRADARQGPEQLGLGVLGSAWRRSRGRGRRSRRAACAGDVLGRGRVRRRCRGRGCARVARRLAVVRAVRRALRRPL